MKRLNIFQKTILSIFLVIPTSLNAQYYCGSNPVSVHGSLKVNGNKIVDKNNDVVSFAGNSFFWSNKGWEGEDYYNNNVVSWLEEDWGTTIVRASMGVEDAGGYISDPSHNENLVRTVVDAAISEGMYVIIDWHSHHAEDYEDEAISFFQEMAQTYKNYPNVIYEIYNEPLGGVSWSGTVKPYAEAVIDAIRDIDSDNLIVVGSPTWSQDVDVASNDPITGYSNIAYALHFYAGTHGDWLRQKAQTAMNNGVALMVTEWGTVNADGNGGVDYGSTDDWMAFLESNDITHLNWAVNDKNEGASALTPGASNSGGWSSGNLTDSGQEVKSIIENWGQYCSGGGDDSGGSQSAYPSGNPHSIPGTINATNFDNGGQGVAYNDSNSGNEGNGSRQGEGVDTENRASGGNVGWINAGEWLEYTVDVQSSGSYTVSFNIASRSGGGQLRLEFDGDNVSGNVDIPSTGNWGSFTNVTKNVSLSSGEQVMRVYVSQSGFNLGNISFSSGDNGGDDEEEADNDGSNIVVMRKRNAMGYAIDGNRNGSNGQSVYLYDYNPSNINQQWIEIDRGSGFYSYKKNSTNGANYCLDGGNGGSNGQDLYLWTCADGERNQHWQKISMGGGAYRLKKRNASYSIDGNNGGSRQQNVYIWASSGSEWNQQWVFEVVGQAAGN